MDNRPRRACLLTIYITSFVDAKRRGRPNATSIARYQPAGFDYPELRMLAPFREDDSPIYWKEYTAETFKDEFMKALASRFDRIQMWARGLRMNDDLTLCCWCDSTRSWCHSTLVGQILESLRPDIEIVYLDGRPGDYSV